MRVNKSSELFELARAETKPLLVYAEREKSQAKLTYGTIPANTGGQD
jgi:hypothetical protein